jgi:hypothetical protein
MKPDVEAAISELQAHYPGQVQATELGDGGAKVVVRQISLADSPYAQADTWCGFTITFAYPYADIYPHFVRPDLARRDNGALGQSFHPGRDFYGEPSVMLSRRTKVFNQDYPMSALLKLEKVMEWMRCP